MATLQDPEILSVLIADDCAVTRRVLALFLRGHGHRVVITENGRECLTAVSSDAYDLIISDIDMPEMNGIECATQIRQRGFDLPIIAITASFPDTKREECFKAGINAFMTKPINFPELKNRLDEIYLEKTHHHPIA